MDKIKEHFDIKEAKFVMNIMLDSNAAFVIIGVIIVLLLQFIHFISKVISQIKDKARLNALLNQYSYNPLDLIWDYKSIQDWSNQKD